MLPHTKSKVKRLLGLRSYYRKFIRNFAKRTYYIRKLTRENTKMR
jgi:hypothetical protein